MAIEPIMLNSTGSSMNDELKLLNINLEKKNFLLQLISDSLLDKEPVDCTGLTLSKTQITNDKDETETLVATATPDNTTRIPRWYSSDPHIATVDENGKVSLIKDGLCTIKVVCGGKVASCSVKVETVNKVDSIKITQPSASVTYPYPTTTLTATYSPSTYNKGITWSSSNTSIATVDGNGLVTFVSPGTATITATAAGKTSSIQVTTEMNVLTNLQKNLSLSFSANSSGKYRPVFGYPQRGFAFSRDCTFIPVKKGSTITFSGSAEAKISVWVMKTTSDIGALTVWNAAANANVTPFKKKGECWSYPDPVLANGGTATYIFDKLYSITDNISTTEASYTVQDDNAYVFVGYRLAASDIDSVGSDYIKDKSSFKISG